MARLPLLSGGLQAIGEPLLDQREKENASFFYPVVSCLLYSYALALMILWDEGKSRSDLTGHITGWNNYLFPKMVDFLVVTH